MKGIRGQCFQKRWGTVNKEVQIALGKTVRDQEIEFSADSVCDKLVLSYFSSWVNFINDQ
jgi:hypothetical protein